jgi:tetrahydromethanopterin S-methyltransferase subunit H
MLLSNRERRAVTTAVFGVTVAILLVVAASGFVLYGTINNARDFDHYDGG